MCVLDLVCMLWLVFLGGVKAIETPTTAAAASNAAVVLLGRDIIYNIRSIIDCLRLPLIMRCTEYNIFKILFNCKIRRRRVFVRLSFSSLCGSPCQKVLKLRLQ